MLPPRAKPRLALAVALLFAAAPGRLAAQLPPLTAPKGLFRLDLGGRFDNWDRTFFAGTKRDAAADFIRDPVTGAWLPELAIAEQRLRELTGVQDIALSLGKTHANMLVNVGTEYLGAAYGLTKRLTLFGTLPYVRVRVQQVFSVDSTGGTAGFNPANPLFGTGATGFLTQLQITNTALSIRIQNGTYQGETLLLAQRVLATSSSLADFLSSATFLPLAGTPAAAALTHSVDSLGTLLRDSLGLDLFSSVPDFPTTRLEPGSLESFATNPNGPIQAEPFEPPILRYLGDVEVGAAFAWLDHHPGSGPTFRSVLQGIVRLRTGKLDQPASLWDLSTGDRQPDVQGDLVTDLGLGRVGARVTARYVLQLPGRQQRRLTPPDQPIAAASTLATVERDPGEIIEGALEPYVRIASHFAIVAGVRHWSKQADTYSYVPNQQPIADTSPNLLAIGSKENGTVLSAALSFVHDGRRADGRTGAPIDAILRGELVTGSSEGRVPAKQSISIMLRLYHKLF